MNPATIAALLLFAAGTAPAIADDHSSDEANVPSSAAQIEKVSKEQARQSNEAAVEEAARAVEANIRLDLDLTLIDRNSVLIAGEI
jgi:outer membrane murein-binding lipoprotein Lpp